MTEIAQFDDPNPYAVASHVITTVAVQPTFTQGIDATPPVDKSTTWVDLAISKTQFTSRGGSTNAIYFTLSAYQGWNAGGNGAPMVSGLTAQFWAHENYFDQENVEADELQYRHYTLEGTQRRPFQLFLPRSDADAALRTAQFEVGRLRIYDQNAVPLILGDNAARIYDIAQGLFFRFTENNTPPLVQKDSGGGDVPLPYVDDLDALRVTSPVHHVVRGAKKNPNDNQSFIYRALDRPEAGDYGEMVLLGGGVVGSFIRSYFSGSASVNITAKATNTHGDGGLRNERTTQAGSIADFNQIGVRYFISGMRASDGAYCISPSGFLDDGGLIVRQNGRVGIASVPPASASAAGKQGDLAWDASYVYVCVADNTWKRTAIATW